MQLQENFPLKSLNTFGIDAKAKYFAAFTSVADMQAILALHPENLMILGGGSNVLLTKDYDGLILHNKLKGIELVKEDADFYYVKAWAGENWHQFVQYCIRQNYAGLENLSLIPGCVGASPMQNIGAYGVEIKDVFHELEGYHIHDKTIVKFNKEECAFGYRESIFKRQYKNQFIILNVTFRLSKQPHFNISYGAIEQELEKMNVKELSIRSISQAVINIRSSKLPNPAEIGNAGSFFKNPQVTAGVFKQLQVAFPGIVGYPVGDHEVKLAAGWLIEQCGWKGYRKGDAGCHSKQALVLVNYGNATGDEIYHLSTEIIQSVQQKFGVTLEREVNIV